MSNAKDFMRAAVASDPGNGDSVVRYIMLYASTTTEVNDIYEVFNKASKRTSEIEVFAARALKKDRLLNKDDQDEDWWWDFYGKAAELGIKNDQEVAVLRRLEEKYPDEG